MTEECCGDYLLVLSGSGSRLTVGYGFNNYSVIIWDIIYYTAPKTKIRKRRRKGTCRC